MKERTRLQPGAHAGPALPLPLHGRCGRREAFACLGIDYNSGQRHLNTGLSPTLPDGGHFIFVTLDKGEFDPAHAYADELYADRLIWVTRRDRSESSEEYVHIRQPDTRVSLFVRNNRGEGFAYLGELDYESHRQFREEGNGRTQQSYVWRLKTPVPDELFRDLTFGRLRPAGRAAPAGGKAVRGRSKGATGRRRPASLDELKRAYSYAVGEGERTVNPEHQRYQARLRNYLRSRGLEAEFERDFVDVSFEVGGGHYIGEVKVTNNLPLKHAFRVALGQLLEYAHLKFERPPEMIMFLDQAVDEARLRLASRFSVSVVCEREGRYVLLNPENDRRLGAVFGLG